MILLRDQIEKCQSWIEKAESVGKDKINLKFLQMLTSEFK